jgi:hypothetical protein
LLVAMTGALALAACGGLPPAQIPARLDGQTQAVVFDIDGTLTPRNADYRASRAGAAEALAAFADKGYRIIYLTSRTPALQSSIPGWLQRYGYPTGSLHAAQSPDDRAHPDMFKARVLEAYAQGGWTVAYAYGDSTTDFAAYAQAGIPKTHVFALMRKGSRQCQPGQYQACLKGWTEHLPYILNQVPVVE